MSSNPSYLIDLQPHRPSTSSTFNLIHLQPSSTFNPSMPLQTFDLPHLFNFRTHTHTHTHTILVRWLDVTRFRKMRIMLRGLRVSPPNRAWKTWSCCSQPIEFWCRRTDALRSGPTRSPCFGLNLHCMSSVLEDRRSLQRACRRFALLLG